MPSAARLSGKGIIYYLNPTNAKFGAILRLVGRNNSFECIVNLHADMIIAYCWGL